ncbi:MAG: signal peptide peptidase SppA [Rubrivivax sp.]|nr:signal peptide peptidase SppA [Rubrivivax sp.]
MSFKPLSWLGRGFRGLWAVLDGTRRALFNLLLLALLVGAVVAWVTSGPPALKPKTALVLNWAGPVVEQRSGSARDSALKQLQGEDSNQTRLRDVLAVLDAAAKDEAITHAVLILDDFAGAGLPTLRELAMALERFKASGKPVTAWGSEFDQKQFFVAAHATQLWLHPMGSVYVEGYGRFRNYYKDLLDRVGVTAHVVRAGKYKNALETYTASSPSPETLEAESALYNSLWSGWTTAVEKARKQPAGSVMAAIDSLPGSLQAAGGNTARWALERKWVDALKTRDEFRAAMIERGAADEDGKSFRQVSFGQYLARLKPSTSGDAVGVIVAQGSISDGQAGPGSIGGRSTADLIRKARDDKTLKALVLRVNSPGGSAFGSELVRRELELTRQAGKPVVVSMGDVAASGGYWISMAADEVLADAGTITGSIGVVGVLPTAEVAMDKLGVHTGGATTTWLAGAFDPRRALDPRFEQLIQSAINHIYGDFTQLVAKARKSTPEKIHEIAQGRVWSGQQALQVGLVDRLGSLGDAVAAAAKLGKLEATARVQYVEADPGRLQMWMQRFGMSLAAAPGVQDLVAPQATQAQAQLQGALLALGLGLPSPGGVLPDLAWLADVAARRQPFASSAHCLCTPP